jgi:DNA invertase Pin-like site-specific DNA recombinase
MRIGYGRVSTRDQHPEAQHDALTAASCDEIFIDRASGKLASRPELDKALLSANRAGDQLVVTRLDWLGRSLEHLISLSVGLQPIAASTGRNPRLPVHISDLQGCGPAR